MEDQVAIVTGANSGRESTSNSCATDPDKSICLQHTETLDDRITVDPIDETVKP